MDGRGRSATRRSRTSSGTESEGGLLAEILGCAPRLAHRADRARADHGRLRADLERCRWSLEAGDDVAAVRDRVGALLVGLARHRRLGADLVYEAYNIDMEAAD